MLRYIGSSEGNLGYVCMCVKSRSYSKHITQETPMVSLVG